MISQKDKVLAALRKGKQLSTKEIASRYGAGNPRDVIFKIRNMGIRVNLIEKKVRGKVTRKYALAS